MSASGKTRSTVGVSAPRSMPLRMKDTHVQAEQRGDDDNDAGQAGVLAPVG